LENTCANGEAPPLGFFPAAIQDDEVGFLVAPLSLEQIDVGLQIVENNSGASNAVGFVVYKSTEFNRSQYVRFSIY
jgi:hypothetical protein